MRPRRVLSALIAATLFTGFGGGTAAAQGAPAAGPATPHADDLLIVDCLLPGQIRRLGTQVTYLSARRAIKTTAQDCGIRGGEYVSYDRANYATALKTWQPLAEQGDVAALTAVGEIYEKGLGVAPDLQAAAQWYRRAADKGDRRAQMNLGAMYEQGRGVPKDPAAAVQWYRRASGLPEGAFQIAPEANAELDRLRGEVGELRKRLDEQQREIGKREQELKDLRRQLEQRRSEAQTERAALDRLREEIEQRRREAAQSADKDEIDRARKALAEREAATARDRQSIAAANKEAERLRDEVARRQQALDAAERAAKQSGEASAAARAEIERLQAEATARGAEADRLRNAGTQRESEVAALSQEAARLREEVARRQQAAEAAERAVRESGATSAAARAEIERLRADAAARGDEAERLRRAEAERANQVAALKARIEAGQKSDKARAEREQANKEAIARLEREVAEREGRAVAKDRELAELRQSLASIERDTTTQKKELDRLKAERAAKGPEIEIIEPELVSTRGGYAARLRGAAPAELLIVGKVDSAAELIALTVNGREEKVESANVFRSRVKLGSGTDQIQIVAIDKTGKRAALEFSLLAPSQGAPGASSPVGQIGKPLPLPLPRERFGAYHALVIGNNDYRFMPKLDTAANDAREVARVLKENYGFNVTLLLNADRYQILSALNQQREKLTDKDNLLIYYAGHGELDRVNQRGHWLPVDAEPNSSANWISNVQITDVLNAMTVRQLLVVADSCYSGTLTRSAVANLEGGLSDRARAEWLSLMLQQHSRMVLTSGGVEPVLDSTGGPHSVFARTFIAALRENIGLLAGQELYQALTARVAIEANRAQVHQVPEYAPIKYAGHESGDFFFIRTVN
jgi:hypothetical protein